MPLFARSSVGAAALALLAGVAAASAAQDPEPRRVERVLEDGSSEVFFEVLRDGVAVRTGAYARTHPDGSRAEEGELLDGERRGPWKSWFPSGRRASHGRYRRGERSGEWTFFHDVEGDAKAAEGEYEDGLRSGWWNFWSADGTHDRARSGYRRGVRWTDARGNRFEDELRRADRGEAELRHGPFRAWRADGTPWMEGDHRAGERHGTWRFWHVDGTLDPEFVSGVYVDGTKVRALAMMRASDLPSAEGLEAVAQAVLGPTAGERAELLPAVEVWSAERDPDDAMTAALLERGPALVPALLEALVRFDLRGPKQRARAERIHADLLVPTFGGSRLLWIPDPSTPAAPLSEASMLEIAARNRLTLLRWLALWELVRDDPLFFELELPVAAAWEPLVPGVALVMNPTAPRPPAGKERELIGPAERYAHRFARNKRRFGETRAARTAIDGALAWLAAHAHDGRFDPEKQDARCAALGHAPCGDAGRPGARDALTGLALLAFLADGHVPGDDGPYGELLLSVLRRLLEGQDPATGRLAERRVHEFFYGHAIVTQALCEALPLVDSPALRRAARAGVDYLLGAQNRGAGWRYEVPPSGQSDTSVTAWSVLALVAARAAGLEVPEQAFDGALTWFESVTDSETGRTGYTDRGSYPARVAGVNDHFPRELSEPLTAAAVLCRILLGQNPDENLLLVRGVQLVARRPPGYTAEALGTDMIGWFFGTHALRQASPRLREPWRAWEGLLDEVVAGSQRTEEAGGAAGSWDPVGVWGFHGRIYATAIAALTLEAWTSYALELD